MLVFKYTHDELYPLIGLRSEAHLPVDGMPATTVDGWIVYVRPKSNPTIRKHRVMAVCKQCGKHLPFGRMNQHWFYNHREMV